jgi:hypothetical protein
MEDFEKNPDDYLNQLESDLSDDMRDKIRSRYSCSRTTSWGVVHQIEEKVRALADASSIVAILEGRKEGSTEDHRIGHDKTFHEWQHFSTMESDIEYEKESGNIELGRELEKIAEQITSKEREFAKKAFSCYHLEREFLELPTDKYMREREAIAKECLKITLDAIYSLTGDKELLQKSLVYAVITEDYKQTSEYRTLLDEQLEKSKGWVKADYFETFKKQQLAESLKFQGDCRELFDEAIEFAKTYIDDGIQAKESPLWKYDRIKEEMREAEERMGSQH